ncbi:MAG: DUF3482 domain-containing protein [Planctomycetaceae bacterium]|nr:DUF3482 domain-containing protein [Planctomycetaceae bacterium]
MNTPTAPLVSVIGTTNIGKSSIIASLCGLSGADKPKIENRPGVTRKFATFGLAHTHVPGAIYIGFMDTPGFQYSEDRLEEVRRYCQENKTFAVPIEWVVQFCRHALERAHNSGASRERIGAYEDDLEAWHAIEQAQLTLFVIDVSNAPEQSPDPLAALEILKATGKPVIVAFNFTAGSDDNIGAWKHKLQTFGFHCARPYDAIVRDYAGGVELLTEIRNHAVFTPEQKSSIDQMIRSLEYKENRRIDNSNRAIAELLVDVAELSLEEHQIESSNVEGVINTLTEEFYRKVTELAIRTEDRLLEIWNFPQSVIVRPDGDYLEQLAGRHSAEGHAAYVRVSVSPYISYKLSYNFSLSKYSSVRVRSDGRVFADFFSRQAHILTALRRRGQAEDDGVLLSYGTGSVNLPDEAAKFLDRMLERTVLDGVLTMLGIKAQRAESVKRLTELLNRMFTA